MGSTKAWTWGKAGSVGLTSQSWQLGQRGISRTIGPVVLVRAKAGAVRSARRQACLRSQANLLPATGFGVGLTEGQGV